MPRRLTKEEFISKATAKHSDKYDYDKADYVNANTKVIIVCKEHGEFEQLPRDHLNGCGCSKCACETEGVVRSLKAKGEFEGKAKGIHVEGLYDYSLVNYKGSTKKIKITCNKCTNTFEQKPSNHLSGHGCPSCASYGFNPGLPAILYYLKVVNESTTTFKIGVTNRSVKERFSSSDLSKIQILNCWSLESGQDAYNLEQTLLKKFSRYTYKGPDILQSGNTELFILNIFVLLSTNYNLSLDELTTLPSLDAGTHPL